MNKRGSVSTGVREVDDREADDLEASGRRWVLLSFLFCPCHLPLTLTVLATAVGSTAAGAALRDNVVAVGVIVTAIWIAGTWRGLSFVRRADACRIPKSRS